jgi:hypothetical protein
MVGICEKCGDEGLLTEIDDFSTVGDLSVKMCPACIKDLIKFYERLQGWLHNENMRNQDWLGKEIAYIKRLRK